MTTTSAAPARAHHMKSSHSGLSMFLPAQYRVTNEAHSQSFESWPMSLSIFTARPSQVEHRTAIGGPPGPDLCGPLEDFRRTRDLAHAAALVVAHRLNDLLLGVHHERTVAGDGLGDRDAGEQQQPARARRAAKAHGVARAEQRELTVANLLALVSDEHRALERVRHRLLPAPKRDGDTGARLDP